MLDETPLVRGTLVRRSTSMQPRMEHVPKAKLVFLVPGVRVDGLLV